MDAAIIQDLTAVIWKELKEFFAGGGSRGRYISLIVLGLFGVVLPFTMASNVWPSSVVPVVEYALYLPVILIISVGADSFAGERERHTLETLLASRLSDIAIFFGKLLAITIFGWAQSMLAAILAIIIVNIKLAGSPGFYSTANALSILGIGALAALAAAGATTLVSLRAATVRQAQQMLSIGLIVIVIGSTFGLQALSPDLRLRLLQTIATSSFTTLAWDAAGILAVLAAILILSSMTLFKRAKLIVGA
jgi:ABC-2 type transport system permease protein